MNAEECNKIDEEWGRCMPKCISYVTGIPEHTIPHFCFLNNKPDDSFIDDITFWLLDKFNINFLWIPIAINEENMDERGIAEEMLFFHMQRFHRTQFHNNIKFIVSGKVMSNPLPKDKALSHVIVVDKTGKVWYDNLYADNYSGHIPFTLKPDYDANLCQYFYSVFLLFNPLKMITDS